MRRHSPTPNPSPEGEGLIGITPFVPGDEDAIIDLIVPIQAEEFGVPITAADQPDLRDIPGFYLPGAGGFWVARHDGRVVGTIALKDIGDGDAALRKMFVARDYRGAPYRTGQMLLDILIDHARAHGLTRIMLGTIETFQAAICFYQRNGFTTIAKADLPPSFPLMPLDTCFYVRDL